MGSNLAQRVKQQNQQVQERQPEGNTLEQQVRSMEAQFKLAMPRGADAAQLVRDTITVLRQNPKLMECEPTSFLGAIMQCAQLGLRPGIGALQQAHILPFWNGRQRRFDAQFIIGYQGMLDLANRSGEIDYVTAQLVCRNDEFIPDPMTGKHKHTYPASGPRGDVIGYYCVFFRKDSDRGQMMYMSKEDMENHRDLHAKAKNKQGQVTGPWADHFDAMALKTTIRLNFKYMPKSTQIENALVADESVRYDLTPQSDLVQVSEQPNFSEPPTQINGQFAEEPPANVNTDTGEVTGDPWKDNAPSPEEQEAIFAAEREGR